MLTGLAGVCSLRAERPEGVGFYFTPGVAIVKPGSDFDMAAALAASFGVSFAKHHSVEVEAIMFDAEPDVAMPVYDLRFRTYLATYKYTFLHERVFSTFLGGSFGRVSQTISVKSGYVVIGETSDNANAYGLSGGLCYRLSAQSQVELAARVISLSKTRFTTSGSMTLVQAACRLEF